MNNKMYQIIFSLILTIAVFAIPAHAQEQEGTPEYMKYFRETYEENYNSSFDHVLNSVKKFIEDEGFRVLSANVKPGDNGAQRAVVQSEICVLTQDPDSAFQHIKMHAHKPPFIRGGVWTSARVKYRFIIEDKGNGAVSVVSRIEYTGWEKNITDKPYDLLSSGLLEFNMFEKIKKLVEGN